ncbi:hypothetical protein L6E12_13785 [Actinokineospora sp. PR83]|uniref:hypothetical protein n=1 Tax=Actinokineospora sp. PR83 TaxID=2884908 RepID=UPI001F3401DA|nr:hypothetical protein [Actinokineospora sp. PR83]MCG8916863.1 hypothetical protein [Actinokineospora sp. PR83]
MSWNDYYRRQAALDAVLAHVRHNPEGPLSTADVPLAAEVFTDTDELLLALHHRWMRRLTGRLEVAAAEADRDPSLDRVEAASAAWRAAAEESSVLHRLLEAHDTEALRPVREAEQRLLALSSGLAADDDSTEEATRTGAAYLAMLRSTPAEVAAPPRRPSAVGLLRRLVASA